MRPLFTGSAIERGVRCAASVSLPRIESISEYQRAGTSLHAFLEAVSLRGRTAALEELSEEDRPTFEAVNIDDVAHLLALTPELALAYDFATGEARVLGQGLERAYDVGPTEIACTMDVVGVNQAERFGVVGDWKRGWSHREMPARNHQMRFGALCLARAFDLVEVEAHLVTYRSEESDPRPLVHRFDVADLDGYALDLDEYLWRKVVENRAAFDAGAALPHVVTGEHCHKCASKFYCTPHTALIRSISDADFLEEHMRVRPMTPEMAARAFITCRSARKMIEAVEGACYAAAAVAPLPLGVDAETGRHRWLGEVDKLGNEELDGEKVFTVIQEFVAGALLAAAPESGEPYDQGKAFAQGAEVAGRATKLVATKGDAEAAVKSFAPRGKKEKAWEAVLERLRAQGGATRKQTRDVQEFTSASPDPGDNPRPFDKRKNR